MRKTKPISANITKAKYSVSNYLHKQQYNYYGQESNSFINDYLTLCGQLVLFCSDNNTRCSSHFHMIHKKEDGTVDTL